MFLNVSGGDLSNFSEFSENLEDPDAGGEGEQNGVMRGTSRTAHFVSDLKPD